MVVKETWVPWIPQRKYSPHRYKGGVVDRNGLVCHIAEGSYLGTIAWQMNTTDPKATTSSEFIVGRNVNEVMQMMPLEDAAWAQRAGNRHWTAIEFAGWVKDGLSQWQILTAARIYVWLRNQYGDNNYPLQLTSDPAVKGIGYHSMGGEHGLDWGHMDCPGPLVIAQRSDILAQAKLLVTPKAVPTLTSPINETDLRAIVKEECGNAVAAFFAAGYNATNNDPTDDTRFGRGVRDEIQTLTATVSDTDRTAIASEVVAQLKAQNLAPVNPPTP